MKFTCKSKYIYVILALTFFAAIGNTYAQQRQAPSAEEIVAKMKQDLNLSDEQAAKITPIVRNQLQQMQTIIEQAQEKVRSQLQALQQNTETKLSQCLTPEQMEQFKNRQQGGQQQQSQPKTNNGANPIDAARSGAGNTSK
ncbi:MAG: hypothetical protein WC412_01205 [Candidatus Omnitrophota bacterium]|jgi:cell division protein FtsX